MNFVKNEILKNVNFVKSEFSKLWILWKMWILWKVSFQNVNFRINWGFLPQCTSLQWIYTPKKGLISAQNSIFPFISSENPMCFWPKFHGNHKKSDQNQWSSEGVLVMHLDLKLEKWVQFQFSCPKTEFLNFSHIFFSVKKCQKVQF